MARGTREQLLTHADQAFNDIGRSVVNLEFMRDTYKELHPEHAAACQALINNLEQLALLLLEFKQNNM